MSDAPAPGAAATLRIADALRQARSEGIDRVDALLLMAHLLRRDKAWLIAHDDQPLAAADAATFAALCQRRAAGEPVAYLVGAREFHGLTLEVTPAVLVPRPDTETLVDWALACLAGSAGTAAAAASAAPPPRVLDLGTGSGAIALAVAHACPRAEVWASDHSAAALAVAQANGRRLGLAVQWWRGDWWQALPADAPRFDLVLANPPYIAAGDPHLAALRHEPQQALVSGADGLDALRQIIAGATAHLAEGGRLLLEHGWDQPKAVAALLANAGFVQIAQRLDLGGQVRCSGGTWPGGARTA